MEKCLFDSHSHISDEAFAGENQEKLIASIGDSLVKYCMDIGTSLKVSADSIESARRYDFCYATVGIHPSEIGCLEGSEERLFECLSAYETEPKVVAVGEIGLDYHYDDGPSREEQRYWFGKQLDWAVEHHAPVCIHSRDADEETMNMLKEHRAFETRVLMHCYSGSWEFAREYLKLGAWISLAGPVTFKNARKPQEVAANIPLDRLLIETDSPYMAPEPVRGTTNTPVNVQYVCRKIAELRGDSFENIAKATLENAKRFYGIE